MKLCFIGNMNNMPLMYARDLRERGHDVDFIVDARRREALHRPEKRYSEYETYPDWMIDRPVAIPLLSYAYPRVFLRDVIRRINGGAYDGLVLDGFAVGLATELVGRKFALLAGADLDVMCDPRSVDAVALRHRYGLVSGRIRHYLLQKILIRQRTGLRACAGFNYFAEGINPRAEQLLAEIYEGLSPYRLQIRGTDCDQLTYSPPSDRRGDDVIIFAPVRFLYREPLPANFSPLENKRNDLIIEGIARYLRESGKSPRIVMVEKGPDVAAAKALTEQLGIANGVTWLKEMTQAEIFEWYRRADIVFDQLGNHIVGQVAWDSMLQGRPVIANARPEVFEKIIPEPSPICHASNADSVAAWLHQLVDSPERRREIGIRSHKYINNYYNKSTTASAIEQFFEKGTNLDTAE